MYGDDHPYIGLTGNIGENFKWELDYTIVYDATERHDVLTPFNGDRLDWRFYSAKGNLHNTLGLCQGFCDQTRFMLSAITLMRILMVTGI